MDPHVVAGEITVDRDSAALLHHLDKLDQRSAFIDEAAGHAYLGNAELQRQIEDNRAQPERRRARLR